MHVGNAFSAVLSWLHARYFDGEYLLRIEDLDPDRCKDEYSEQIRDDLAWLGLDWDAEGPRQSTRAEAYRRVFESFCEKGLIYPCYCSRAALHAASAPHSTDGNFVYPGTCRSLGAEDRKKMTKTPSYRIIVPDRCVSFVDHIQGPYSENLARDCGDFVLCRPDGVFSYQLAVTVDDAAMGVNQIVRGRDLLSSTPRQIWLLELMDAPAPEYYHVPLLLGPDGHRLSKRYNDVDFSYVREHKKPEEMIGYIAYLSGITANIETLSLPELLAEFSPDKVSSNDVVMDLNEWFS